MIVLIQKLQDAVSLRPAPATAGALPSGSPLPRQLMIVMKMPAGVMMIVVEQPPRGDVVLPRLPHNFFPGAEAFRPAFPLKVQRRWA